MPQKPAAPNPAPPKQDADAPEYIFAMHRWRYPLHHFCTHFRGYPSEVATVCAPCGARYRREDRRRLAGAVLACLVAFGLTLIGCCAAGGDQ
jgi:hypothetical protein